MTRLVGLYREQEYSPGPHLSNDRMLLDRVADQLRARRFHVETTTIDKVDGSARSAALVFSMCQGRAALDLLDRLAQEGMGVINTPLGSLNTYRERLTALLRAAGIRFPPTWIVSTGRDQRADVDLDGGLWVKRGDVHAAVRADVQWVDSAGGLQRALGEFADRGIGQVALQRHQEGTEVKFYAVAGRRFFHWLYASSGGPDAALPARPRTESRTVEFDVGGLQQIAEEAAAALGLEVFGGDAIVGPTGELTLIDLNDWPSFAP